MATRSNSPGCFRDIAFNGLSHPMDLRSPAGLVGAQNWRLVLNVASTELNQTCRLGGWRRLFAGESFNNEDLHDQLLTKSVFYDEFSQTYYDASEGFYDSIYCGSDLNGPRDACREPITLLYEFETEASRKLIAATESRIYELDEGTGNWRIIADGLGGVSDDNIAPPDERVKCDCGGRRFSVAQMGNYLLFVNGLDPVLAYRGGDPASGCGLMSVFAVPDLVALGVTRAKTIASWKGFVFLGGVSDDAGDHRNRIMWSDFNDAMSWDTAPADTEAGLQDVSLDEDIVALVAGGEFMWVFTSDAIYQVILVEASQGRFRFRRVYAGPDVCRFPYGLAWTGEAVIYAGETSLYQLTPENPKPQVIDWLDLAAGAIYKGVDAQTLGGFLHLAPFGPVNKQECDEFIMFFDPVEKTVWASWPTDSNVCPTMSLRLDLKQSFSSLVNKGFTAGISFRPDTRPSVAEFLAEWQVCPLDSWTQGIKDGDALPAAAVPFPNPPAFLFNATENPDLPIDPDSLCARWGNLRLSDICDACAADPILVLADAIDFTLKQYEPDTYYRELYRPNGDCAGAAFSLVTADGSTYCAYGYSSLMQSDLDKLGIDTEKLINKAVVDFEAVLQTTPNKLAFQIAVSGQPKCSTWNSLDSKDLACVSSATVEEHAAANTRAAGNAKFPAYLRGRYVGWRFYVLAPDEISTITGGGARFNALTLSIRNTQTQAAW